MSRKYNQGTLARMRNRKKKLKCKFKGVSLQVDGCTVNLKVFKMLKGIDYHHQFRGIVLDKDFRFTVIWTKGGKVRATTLTGNKGDWFDGASIPNVFQEVIGAPLSPQFLVASLGHDLAILQEELPHEVESMVLYKLLHYQRGNLDIPWWKERAMFLAVYGWSLLSS